MRSRASSLTSLLPFRTRETVLTEYPASFAISTIVIPSPRIYRRNVYFLALDSTCKNSFYYIFLARNIKDNNWQNCKNKYRHHGTPVDLSMTLFQKLDCDRNGFILINIQHQTRQKVIIPYPHRLKDCYRYRRWL